MGTPTSVEDYLVTVPPDSRAALQKLRDTIKAAVPEATETISYQIPTVKLHGRSLVAYAAFKDHCSLFPMSMSIIDAYKDQLKPYWASKGTLHFQPDKPLPTKLVKAIVKVRVKELEGRRR